MSPDPRSPEALLAHAGFLHGLARSLVLGDEDAGDYVQETFAYAIARPPGKGTHLRPWLGAALRNFLRQDRRARLRRLEREARAARPESDDTVRALERERARHRVVTAVTRLPEPYRTAVVLRYLEGLPPREIARRTGAPVETVRTRIQRALARLRKDLDRENEGDRRAWCLALLPLARARGTAGLAAVAAGALALKTKHVVVVAVLLALLAVGVSVLPRGGSRNASPARVDGDPAPAIAEAGATDEDTPEPGAGASAPGRSVHGTVRDRGGKPVPGAVLLAVPADLPGRTGWSGEATTTAAEDGGFDLPLPETCPLYELIAVAPGLSPALVERVRPGNSVEMVLDPPVAISGRVRDLAGRPVSDAGVRWVWRLPGIALTREGRTASDGTFTIEHVPAASAVHGRGDHSRSFFAVDAEGYAPLTVPWAEAGWSPGQDRVELWVGRGATVEGTVTDAETGAALAGARVLLVLTERPSLVPVPGAAGLSRIAGNERVAEEVVADGQGAFRFSRVPSRAFHSLGLLGSVQVGHVAALAPGYASGIESIPVPAEGARVPVSAKLWPGAAIAGRVVDETGRPVAGTWVGSAANARPGGRSVPVDGPWSAFAKTDADGRYRLDAVPALRSRAVAARVRARRASIDVTIRAGEETVAPDLTLGASASTGRGETPAVVVQVVDRAGAPIWAASVGRTALSNEVRTGPDGRARLAYERAGTVETAIVRAPGYAPAETPPFRPDAADPPVVGVVLDPGRSVAGRIAYDDGTPVVAGTLYALPAGVAPERVFDERGRPVAVLGAPGMPRIPVLGITGTDGEGRFVLADLPDAPVTVVCIVRGLAARAERTGVPAGTRDLDLRVPGSPDVDRGVLECRVRDAVTGAPVPRFAVEIERADGGDDPIRRRDERPAPGEWRTALPAGRYLVRIVAEGYVAAEREVEVEEDGPPAVVDLAISRGGTVRGRIFGPELPDMNGASVAFVALGAGPRTMQWSHLGPDGSYEVSGLAPGRYRLDIYLNPQLAGGPAVAPREPVTVVVPSGGGDASLDVEAVAAAWLEVRWEEGEDARARVVVRDGEGRVASDWPDLGPGSGVWLHVPPGTFTVTLVVSGREALVKTVTVAGGDHSSVVFAPR